MAVVSRKLSGGAVLALLFASGWAPGLAQAQSSPQPAQTSGREPPASQPLGGTVTASPPSVTASSSSAFALDAGVPAAPPRVRARSRPPPSKANPDRQKRRRRRRSDRARARRQPDAGVVPDAGFSPDAGSFDAGLTTPAPVFDQTAQRVWEELGESVSIFVPTARLRSLTDPVLLALLIGLSLLISGGAGHLRPYFARDGLLPRLLGFLHMAGRFAALALTVLLLVRASPDWLRPAVPWVLLAAAVAVGWSARDLLPDLLAGGVLFYERRVRRGVWLSAEGLSGTVERLGLRATWLTDELGQQVAVPNRRLLTQAVIVADQARAWHETRLRIASRDQRDVRRVLAHAVATSVWVVLGSKVELSQDVDDPAVWHVRVCLRHRRDQSRFDGELRGRVAAMMAVDR